MLAEALKPKVIELAGGIFTRLVGDTVKYDAKGTVQMGCDPELIARLSFKLAAVFQNVEDGLNRDSLPKNPDFKLSASDIADWSK